MTDEPAAPTEQQEIRPPRETPNYGLPVPGDAGPADYVEDTGRLADAIDEHAGMFFPGDYRFSGSRREREGWLLCDGRAVRRDLYPDLFDEIGEDHGAGDGEETFNLPNFVDGRFPLGVAAARLGERGGAATHTLSIAELAHHAHVPSDPGHLHGGNATTFLVGTNTGVATRGAQDGPNFGAITAGDAINGYTDHRAIGLGIFGEGGNGAHNNMPPYLGVNVFIKT
jgi:microcystin-dependent protein